MAAGKKMARLHVFAVVGLFIFLTDLKLLNAATIDNSGTQPGLQQAQTGDSARVKRQVQPKTQTPPPLLQFVFQRPLVKAVGNVAKGAADVIDKINPLNIIFPHQNPTTAAISKATVAAATHTTQKSTSALKSNRVRQQFVAGEKQTTTVSPVGVHGRGFPALMFTFGNITQSILEITGAVLHWFDHSEPSYLMNRIHYLLQDVGALIDIYEHRDDKGGIGEILKHVEKILANIQSLAGSVQGGKSVDVLQLLAAGQAIFQNINNLKDDFIEPVSTTPMPGGLIGNILGGLQNLIKPQSNSIPTSKTNHTKIDDVPGDFREVVRNTGKLVHTLGEIEVVVQSHDPNSILLQLIGKIKDFAELSLTNDTLDNENVLDVFQKVWFPNTTLTEIIGNFGKILQHYFSNIDIAEGVGGLLQQKMLVDMGLNIVVRNLDFLRFGNIKMSLLQAFADIGNNILGNDMNKLLAGGIDILEKLAEAAEWLLKTFHAVVDPIFSNT